MELNGTLFYLFFSMEYSNTYLKKDVKLIKGESVFPQSISLVEGSNEIKFEDIILIFNTHWLCCINRNGA